MGGFYQQEGEEGRPSLGEAWKCRGQGVGVGLVSHRQDAMSMQAGCGPSSIYVCRSWARARGPLTLLCQIR